MAKCPVCAGELTIQGDIHLCVECVMNVTPRKEGVTKYGKSQKEIAWIAELLVEEQSGKKIIYLDLYRLLED